MSRGLKVIATICFVLAVLPPALAGQGRAAARPPADQVGAEPYVPGELLVKFEEGAPSASARDLREALSAKEIKEFPGIGVHHWKLGKGLSVEQALEILARHRSGRTIEYAEPNFYFYLDEMPNDPLRGELWGLHNVGQSGGTRDADIDAPEAWNFTTGNESVVVAIIDSGIDLDHPDLAPNIDPQGKDFCNGDNDPSDDYGHGTHVSGTIGAVGNDSVGVAGVAWHVKLLPIKAFNASGTATTTALISSIQYATQQGAAVISASWGGGQRSKAMQDAIAASGALFVASAGNAGSTTKQYPAGFDLDNILSVAATDRNDALASWSNRGASWVDLGAPGVDVFSTYLGGSYETLSGTSMAAPHVSGVAALVKSLHMGFTPLQVKNAILGNVDPVPSLAGLTLTGGRLNAARSVGVEPVPSTDTTAPLPVTDLGLAAATKNTLTLTWTATGDLGGSSGVAYLYDLRYATTPISDEASWAAATLATGEPLPESEGTAQTVALVDLVPGTTYWVALKAFDEAGNVSPLSNVAQTQTVPGPHWEVTALPEAGAGNAAIAYAPDGTPSVAYSSPDGFTKFARWTGTEWAAQTVGPGGGATDLAYDPADGYPSVSWGSLKFAHWTGLAWKVETIEQVAAINGTSSLAFGPDGPTIAYCFNTRKGSFLQFVKRNGSAWAIQTVDQQVRYCSLAYGHDGNPAIAYSADVDGDNRLETLRLARWNGGTWSFENVETGTVGFGVFASLAFDPAGNPAVAHGLGASGLRFVSMASGTWLREQISPDGHGSLAYIGPDPIVSYVQDYAEVRLARRQPTQVWSSELVTRVTTYGSTDLAVDPSGLPSFCYYDDDANQAMWARWVPE